MAEDWLNGRTFGRKVQWRPQGGRSTTPRPRARGGARGRRRAPAPETGAFLSALASAGRRTLRSTRSSRRSTSTLCRPWSWRGACRVRRPEQLGFAPRSGRLSQRGDQGLEYSELVFVSGCELPHRASVPADARGADRISSPSSGCGTSSAHHGRTSSRRRRSGRTSRHITPRPDEQGNVVAPSTTTSSSTPTPRSPAPRRRVVTGRDRADPKVRRRCAALLVEVDAVVERRRRHSRPLPGSTGRHRSGAGVPRRAVGRAAAAGSMEEGVTHTVDEQMAWSLARCCRPGDVLVVGVAHPARGGCRAARPRAPHPDLVLIEAAAVDVSRTTLRAMVKPRCRRRSGRRLHPGRDPRRDQRGRVTLQFVSPAQVDGRGSSTRAGSAPDGTRLAFRVGSPTRTSPACGGLSPTVPPTTASSRQVDFVTGAPGRVARSSPLRPSSRWDGGLPLASLHGRLEEGTRGLRLRARSPARAVTGSPPEALRAARGDRRARMRRLGPGRPRRRAARARGLS